MRKKFQKVLSELIETDSRLVLLLGDIGVFGFREVIQRYPTRALNLGILEQAMTSFAAGLSKQGCIPVVHSIAPFLIERPYEQLKIDFGYQKLPGKFISVGASYDYSSLGATHHCPNDVSLLLKIPEFEIFIPSNSAELENQLRDNLTLSTLSYFRLSEFEFYDSKVDNDCALPQKIRQGSHARLVCIGPSISSGTKISEEFDLECVYLNSITQKSISELNKIIEDMPCDLILLQPFSKGTLLPLLNLENQSIRILDIGVPRIFIHEYGDYEELTNSIGLGLDTIRKQVCNFLKKSL